MTHLTYLEAAVVGLVQGVSELFPVSSLGHNVLIPALIGGAGRADLNVAEAESPYLAFIVGLHVATALALLRLLPAGLGPDHRRVLSSIRERRVETADQRLAWMIVLATIPVGLVGLVAEHPFRVLFGKPIVAGVFLAINGVILIAGERFRRQDSLTADERIAASREAELVMAGGRAAAQPPTPGPAHARPRAASTGGMGQSEEAAAVASDRRLSTMGYGRAIVIGSANAACLERGNQSCCIEQGPSADIDEDHPRFHQREGLRANDVFGFGR